MAPIQSWLWQCTTINLSSNVHIRLYMYSNLKVKSWNFRIDYIYIFNDWQGLQMPPPPKKKIKEEEITKQTIKKNQKTRNLLVHVLNCALCFQISRLLEKWRILTIFVRLQKFCYWFLMLCIHVPPTSADKWEINRLEKHCM